MGNGTLLFAAPARKVYGRSIFYATRCIVFICSLHCPHVAGPRRTHLVAGKTILILDDVCTTGATLNEAASVLSKAGAKSIYAYTVARAISHKDA